MRTRTFGRTGWQISEVSLGGAYLQGSNPVQAQENANAVVQRALELGINYMDTAPLYGHSEELLGEALENVTQPFYLATKVGFDPEGFDYRRETVLWSLERSLKRLRLSKLSVAQIHEVNKAGWDRIMEPGGTLAGLREAQKRGLCEKIGITGRAISLLARLAESGEFDSVLVYHDYHPCCQKAAEAVIPAAANQNMGIVIATALAGGMFVEGPRQTEALNRLPEKERSDAEATITHLRQREGTLPQEAFRYVLGDARVSTVCSGAASPEELEEVARASDMGGCGR